MAHAWLLVDAADGKILASHHATERLPIASTTKLMTAYLALKELPLSRPLVAPAYSPQLGESLMGLVPGERDSVRDLLYGMLLPSGNDAAVTLADGVAGSVSAFVVQMNATARRLGLSETHYSTPVGLDSPDNYSSARDLLALTQTLRENPTFRRIVATRRKTLHGGAKVRHLTNTNQLLADDASVNGVKTGSTDLAQHVLVSSATQHGVTLLAALLGAPSEATRDSGSLALLRYGFSEYEPRTPVKPGQIVGQVPVRYARSPLALKAAGKIELWARADQDVAVRLNTPKRVTGPLSSGARIGTATVSLEGRPMGTVVLRADRSVAAPVIAGAVEQALPGEPSRGLAGILAAALATVGILLAASVVTVPESR